MTYVNAVKFINSIKNTVPSPERMRLLCRYLGDPQRQLRFVHIAGGSGKTSCATMLSVMLTESGYKTGSLTSPFVREHREHIMINRSALPHSEFASFVETVIDASLQMRSDIESAASVDETVPEDGLRAALPRYKITKNLLEGKISPAPTASEIICAAALLAFKHHDCQICILECGDSRADPTGIIDPPLVAVVCGSTFTEEQLRTGAGIIRRGTREVVTSAPAGEAYSTILDACARVGSRLTVPARAELKPIKSSLCNRTFEYRGKNYSVPYCAEYQLSNALTAIEAIYSLRRAGVTLHSEDIAKGLARARVPLRFELISVSPSIIIDCPSDENDARAFCESLNGIRAWIGQRLTFVCPANYAYIHEQSFTDLGFSVECALHPQSESQLSELARLAVTMSSDQTLIVLGDPQFCGRVKAQIEKRFAYGL